MLAGRLPFSLGPDTRCGCATPTPHATLHSHLSSKDLVTLPFVSSGSGLQGTFSVQHCPSVAACLIGGPQQSKSTTSTTTIEAASEIALLSSGVCDLLEDHASASWLIPRRFVVRGGMTVDIDSACGLNTSVSSNASPTGTLASRSAAGLVPANPQEKVSNKKTLRFDDHSTAEGSSTFKTTTAGGKKSHTSSSSSALATNALKDTSNTADAVDMHSASVHVPLSTLVGCSAGSLVLQSVAKALLSTQLPTDVHVDADRRELRQSTPPTVVRGRLAPQTIISTNDTTREALISLVEDLFASTAVTFATGPASSTPQPPPLNSTGSLSSMGSATHHAVNTEDPVEMAVLSGLQTLYALQYQQERPQGTSLGRGDPSDNEDAEATLAQQQRLQRLRGAHSLQMPTLHMAALALNARRQLEPAPLPSIDLAEDDDNSPSPTSTQLRNTYVDMQEMLREASIGIISKELLRRQ